MKVLVFLQRTVGQKILVGLTGLGLCVFLLIHMAGNLLILSSSQEYNLYAHTIHSSLFLELLEKGLFLTFIGHIVLAVVVNIKNKQARQISYQKNPKGLKKTFMSQRLLIAQGAVIFGFLIWHLLTFKFGEHYEVLVDGQRVRDIYRLVVEVFQNPLYGLTYGLVLVVLSFHVFHGLPASLKSLGLPCDRFEPTMSRISFLFASLIALGFLWPIVCVLGGWVR